MHRDGHTVGDADLLNDQVAEIGKYRHRLILDQENGSVEILFCPLFYHIAIIGPAEDPQDASTFICIVSTSFNDAYNRKVRCVSRSAVLGGWLLTAS